MTTNVGLWIDHREAVLVTLTGDEEETKRIESDVEKRVKSTGSGQAASEDDLRDNRIGGQLSKYYDRVIASIGDADGIFILGPGEAKGELEKRLQHHNLGERIVAVETADKLTDRQIAARVREQFAKKG